MVTRVPEQRNTLGGYAVLDDRLLVLDFQAGNPQAFVEIHQRYGPLARRVCRRFLPDPQDVDEAFQETMIRVYQGLYRFNGRYALQPWVARIAKNVSLDILRGRARRPQNDAWAPPAEDLAGPDDEADQIVERLVQHDTVLDRPLRPPGDAPPRADAARDGWTVASRDRAGDGDLHGAGQGADPSGEGELPEAVAREGGRTGWPHGDRSLPLVWLLRIAGGLRRIGERLGHSAQVAQVAVPEAVSSTVATTAAPVVSSGVGERVVAAGMTLLLAGGVTVGAAKIVRGGKEDKGRGRSPKRWYRLRIPQGSARRLHPSTIRPSREVERATRVTIRAEPPVVVEPEPSPVVEPSPAVSRAISITGRESVSGTHGDAASAGAEWTMRFASDLLGEPSSLSLSSSESPGKALRFSQTVTGSLDGPKDTVTDIYLEYWGSGKAGNAEVWLFLDTPAGRYEYRAIASLASVTPAQDGSAVYVFTGWYDSDHGSGRRRGQHAARRVDHLELAFWTDGVPVSDRDGAGRSPPDRRLVHRCSPLWCRG